MNETQIDTEQLSQSAPLLFFGQSMLMYEKDSTCVFQRDVIRPGQNCHAILGAQKFTRAARKDAKFPIWDCAPRSAFSSFVHQYPNVRVRGQTIDNLNYARKDSQEEFWAIGCGEGDLALREIRFHARN